jgi:hypothetical protein
VGALHLGLPRAASRGHDPGKNRRRSVLGAVDLTSGRFFYQVAAKAISATCTAFCEHPLAAYPTAPVVVICDKGIIHRSKDDGRLDRRRVAHRPTG